MEMEFQALLKNSLTLVNQMLYSFIFLILSDLKLCWLQMNELLVDVRTKKEHACLELNDQV